MHIITEDRSVMQKMSKKALAAVMAIIMVLLCLPCNVAYAVQNNATKVAYIPIDNRPVNYQRVQWLAESIGLELLMPDEQLFRTALDNMPPNEDGSTCGNRQALLDWLKSIEGECDYYIISLDQMLSGGLVSSRAMTNTDLSFEYEICDYIAKLAKKHTVILFDTVMRLASTVDYNGYGYDSYTETRRYGARPRKTLTGSDLTVENIIANYGIGPDGKNVATNMSPKQLSQYHASRARKLMLADYMLRNSAKDLDFCFIGVDDSTRGNSIQTNEIAYIRKLLGDNCNIAAATDEFGMLCIARVAYLLYGSAKVNVEYFGGAENEIADDYDYDTLKNDVDGKLRSLGCKASKDDDAMNLLVVTPCNNRDAAANQLINKAKAYLDAGKCVAIVDPNTYSKLPYLVADNRLNVGLLLGYSNWNTAANALGLCMSMSISRYLYLKNEPNISPASHDAFLKSITFAYVKDISYKMVGKRIESQNETGYGSFKQIMSLVNSSEIIVSLKPYTTAKHGAVSGSNYRYPWLRQFEMVFDISVAPLARDKGDINGDGSRNIADYMLCRRIQTGCVDPDTTYFAAADINSDGEITNSDALLIKKHIQRIELIK